MIASSSAMRCSLAAMKPVMKETVQSTHAPNRIGVCTTARSTRGGRSQLSRPARQPESTPPWLQRENAAAAAAAARAGKLRSHGAAAGEGSPTRRTRERIQASIAAAKGAAARTTSPTKFERLQTAELARFERVQADLTLPARTYPRDFKQKV